MSLMWREVVKELAASYERFALFGLRGRLKEMVLRELVKQSNINGCGLNAAMIAHELKFSHPERHVKALYQLLEELRKDGLCTLSHHTQDIHSMYQPTLKGIGVVDKLRPL